jgi:diguanylate cyclase (GGDEF)-like protein
MEHAEAEWQRAQREKRPLSLVILDLDRLKEINDTFGHLFGDQALTLVSALMRQGMRRYDWVGRWGGDEFLLVLPGTGTKEAFEVAERLRLRVRQTKLHIKHGQEIELHLSLGVAGHDLVGPDDLLSDLLAKADGALYEAKQGGRDQVRLAD